jgi:hypothetical protein
MLNKFISSIGNIDLVSNFGILISTKCLTSDIHLSRIKVCLVKISKILVKEYSSISKVISVYLYSGDLEKQTMLECLITR